MWYSKVWDPLMRVQTGLLYVFDYNNFDCAGAEETDGLVSPKASKQSVSVLNVSVEFFFAFWHHTPLPRCVLLFGKHTLGL